MYNGINFIRDSVFVGNNDETLQLISVYKSYSVGYAKTIKNSLGETLLSDDKAIGLVLPTYPTETCILREDTTTSLEYTQIDVNPIATIQYDDAA